MRRLEPGAALIVKRPSTFVTAFTFVSSDTVTVAPIIGSLLESTTVPVIFTFCAITFIAAIRHSINVSAHLCV